MDKETWKTWKKELDYSDEEMIYFFGNPGDPVDTSDVDDFFNGGGQLEGGSLPDNQNYNGNDNT
jgi:hypothetical protein